MREARGNLLVGAQAVDEVVHHRGDGEPLDLSQTHGRVVQKERMRPATLTPALSLKEGEGVTAIPRPGGGEGRGRGRTRTSPGRSSSRSGACQERVRPRTPSRD